MSSNQIRKTKVLKLKQNLIKIQFRLLNSLSFDSEEAQLYQDAIILCDKFLSCEIDNKYFNDHLYLINLGIQSFILKEIIQNEGLVMEE